MYTTRLSSTESSGELSEHEPLTLAWVGSQFGDNSKNVEDTSRLAHYTVSEDTIAADVKDKLRALRRTTENIQDAGDTVAIEDRKDTEHSTYTRHALMRDLNGQREFRPVGRQQAATEHQMKTAAKSSHMQPQISSMNRDIEYLRLEHTPNEMSRQLETRQKLEDDVCVKESSTEPYICDSNHQLYKPPPSQNESWQELGGIDIHNSISAILLDSAGSYDNRAANNNNNNPNENFQRCAADASQITPTSTSIPDALIVEKMAQYIEHLEVENKILRDNNRPLNTTKRVPKYIQVFHCLNSDNDDDDTDNDDYGPSGYRRDGQRLIYLSEPDWEVQDERAVLRGRSRIRNPIAYAKAKNNVLFIVYKYYNNDHQLLSIKKAMENNEPLPNPEPFQQDILLLSEDMMKGLDALFAHYPNVFHSFPEINVKRKMSSPFLWWFECRKLYRAESLESQQAKMVQSLTDWINTNYASQYDKVEHLIDKGLVSNTAIEYLIRPGDIIIKDYKTIPRGYLATSHPRKQERERGLTLNRTDGSDEKNMWSWKISLQSIAYEGDFFWVNEIFEISIETDATAEENPVSIIDLDIVPIQYVSEEIRSRLKLRGETFWNCRDKRLVSYEGSPKDRRQAGQRFMVDFKTYKELHPNNSYVGNTKGKELFVPSDGNSLDEFTVYLFPTLIPGFDLRRKQWTDLEVDYIRDVAWNDEAFKNLVADEDMKELILALVTNQLDAETSTDLIENKGNGLIMLLHGSPGTGKTFTAESVAEIAKKPLYPVTCGDIATDPGAVEKYLESVFYLGKVWDCVVLLDEAEVFLEQRTLQDLSRNALVSVFLRALEYYEGILILTTNRVGTFDEAFKSRIQLALRYEPLKAYQRKQIWRNFFTRLEKLGEQDSIAFDEIEPHIDELVRYPMNGRQIRNSISTARQLAKFKKKKMTFAHLTRAILEAEKFDKYLADVRDAEIKEPERATTNGRYTDEFFARSDQLR